MDDFYLNLLDWSSKNILAVALHNSVYLYNANNFQKSEVMIEDLNVVTSVSWSLDGKYLGIFSSGISDV